MCGTCVCCVVSMRVARGPASGGFERRCLVSGCDTPRANIGYVRAESNL